MNDVRPDLATALQAKPTHAAVSIKTLGKLIKYFKETPMPHDVSNEFVQDLAGAQLVNLDSRP